MPNTENTTIAPIATTTAKPAKPAKPARAKAQKPAPAPIAAPALATDTASDRAAERIAAAAAISAFYNGRSLPFKAASDKFAELRLDKAPKQATERQAALLAAMLIAGDNVQSDGTFTRGAFIHDGKRVQPETGCLSDMLNRTITHVSGGLSGSQARDAIFRIDLTKARAEISAKLGDKLGKLAIARIDKLLAA